MPLPCPPLDWRAFVFRLLNLPSPKFLRVAFAACLFLLVLSAKWATFDRYGSAMPDWDQWDAEALETYVPWFTHDHFLSHLFAPHNEHRVILTKLQNLTLVLLNGQWDSRLQAVTNAAVHALLATAFWLLALRLLSPHPTPHPLRPSRLTPLASSLLFLLAFVLFGLPLAWQNVLGGFHSQQYWLALLSFAAIVTLPFARAFSALWWLGAVGGILALGSMGSGFLAAFAVLLVLAFRLARRETELRATAPSLVLCAILVAIGALTRHEVPWHAEMKAKTVHDFAFSIIHSLQWPWRDQHWAALVLWLPWLFLAYQVLRPASSLSPRASRLAQAVLALGGWVLLQLVATAYARGAGADYPASRYMDTLTFGAMANALALACLAPRLPLASRLAPLASLWLLTLGAGLYNYLAHTARWELDGAKSYYVKAEGNMRRYLATNDPKHFANPDIPFPSAEGLVERLAIPSLRVLMPVPLRTPLPLKPATPAATDTFRANTAINVDIENPPRAGLSPKTPPLDYTTTWGSFSADSAFASATSHAAATSPAPAVGTAQWRSAPLAPTAFAYLKFEVAGTLGPTTRDVSLELRDAATDALIHSVRPSRTPGDHWRSAYVPMPRAPFVVVAQDQSTSGWLAFSGPVEMARLSYLAWQATKHAALIFVITLAVTTALAVLVAIGARRPAPSTA